MFYGWRKHLPLLTHVSNHHAILFMTCKQIITVCFVVVIEFLMVNLPQTNWTCFYERLHSAFWKKRVTLLWLYCLKTMLKPFFTVYGWNTYLWQGTHTF